MNIEGIQPPYVAFYSLSIRASCEAAMASIEELAAFVERVHEANGEYQMTGELQNSLLDHLQNLLIHAAAISRYFWPSKSGPNGLHRKRAKQLREMFEISDESPLRNREMRNQIEHFDENLDLYLAEKPLVGYVLPAYVGGTPESDEVPVHLFRAFYLDTAVFEVLGVRHELQPLVDELTNLFAHFHAEEST